MAILLVLNMFVWKVAICDKFCSVDHILQLVKTRHAPWRVSWTVLVHQYDTLLCLWKGSKHFLNFMFQAVPILAILEPGTSKVEALKLASITSSEVFCFPQDYKRKSCQRFDSPESCKHVGKRGPYTYKCVHDVLVPILEAYLWKNANNRYRVICVGGAIWWICFPVGNHRAFHSL